MISFYFQQVWYWNLKTYISYLSTLELLIFSSFQIFSFRTFFTTNSHSLPIKTYCLAVTQLRIFKLSKSHFFQKSDFFLKTFGFLINIGQLLLCSVVRIITNKIHRSQWPLQMTDRLHYYMIPLFLINKGILSCTTDLCCSPINFAQRQMNYLLTVFCQKENDPLSNYWILFFSWSTPKIFSKNCDLSNIK